MSHLHYITGAAGTGKTHALAGELVRWVESNTLADYQGVLAITRMHGSRKRLRDLLDNRAIQVRLTVNTVDRFALYLVNRWRLSLGHDCPIVPDNTGGMVKDELGVRATFDEIMSMAAQLTSSPIVAKTIANSFPVILVDEFQDCTGNQLALISALKDYTDLILAADPFQALDADESACKWALGYEDQGTTTVTRLGRCWRSETSSLLEAADALLHNEPARYSKAPMSFYCAPRYAMAVWKVLPPQFRENETAALIYPVNTSMSNLRKSVQAQCEKRIEQGKRLPWFPWRAQLTDKELYEQTNSAFNEAVKRNTWMNNGKWHKLYRQAQYLSKARGYEKPPEKYLSHVVTGFVQARKFVSAKSKQWEATTVHGAKNREFDHVFVVWDNNLCSRISDDRKRRLLYNAITRARASCTIVGIGTCRQLARCPVLSLLGTPQDAFKSHKVRKRGQPRKTSTPIDT
jgi:superfamily I DNA/RNA helicase